MKTVPAVLGALLLGGALFVGTQAVGPAPPLGAFLDPVRGVWALAITAEHPPSLSAVIPALRDSVDIRYDDRGVPHIFARNELDAIRALGYVVARDRLFQLELQTRASGGTLTELVGDIALDADRDTRQIGLPWGAKRKYAATATDTNARQSMEAYADGVNAYIRQMRPQDLPLEYRLLNKKPIAWEPQNTMLLLARMGFTLAWSEFELERVRVEARVGKAAAEALFPRDAYIQEPIQPNGQREPRITAAHIPPPVPDTAAAAFAKVLAALAPRAGLLDGPVERGVGSNNWAVSPKRSANGHALLANDPHLELSLPSTWYEAHIVVRDSLDVYGVTFPGAPTIVLGLNRDIAWGSTNVGADVADYYVETVDNAFHPTKYKVNGEWGDLAVSLQRYLGKNGELLAIDTLYYTHRGPMNRVGSLWISRRWLVLEPSADFESFRRAPRAHSVKEFFDAMSSFVSPAQNFIVADRQGHIGIRSTGKYPIRPAGADGQHLIDGSKSANDWSGWITPDKAPQTIDPPQGYIASANQQPADPRAFPQYMGDEWPSPWRAMQINKLLRADTAVTADAMRRYQTDPGSARADLFVPLFIAAAQAQIDSGRGNPVVLRGMQLLLQWDRRYTPNNQRAVLFETAMTAVSRLTWDEIRPAGLDGPPMPVPAEQVLYALTLDPHNVWWDRSSSKPRESRDDIFVEALRYAVAETERARGSTSGDGWTWSNIRFANIWHPLRLEALSALRLSVQGGRETLNPSSGNGTHGASWRLVAEMGPTISARGIYPGGQSANPLSSHYRDRIERWRVGELDSLRIPATPDALTAAHARATLTLRPGLKYIGPRMDR